MQAANWHPPKCKLGRGDFCVVLYKNCRSEVANPILEGDLHFRGCQFGFWSPNCLGWGGSRKGGKPKKVGTLGSRDREEREQIVFSKEGPRVAKLSLAPVQPWGCTGASLGLRWSMRHFRDSRAILRKDNLLPLLPIQGESRNSGIVPGPGDRKRSK